MCNNLFDDCATAIGLLMKNDRLYANAFQKASNRFARTFVTAMHDENFALEGRMVHESRFGRMAFG